MNTNHLWNLPVLATIERPSLQEDDFIRQLTVCQNPLKSFIWTLLGNSRAVDEVLQETHVEMWVQREKFAAGTNFFAWACQIAHFKVLQHRQSSARDRLVLDAGVLEKLVAESTDYHARFGERGEALEDCLRSLPPRQRKLLQERYVAARSAGELANELNRSESSINVALFRIRKALLACVQRKLAVETRR